MPWKLNPFEGTPPLGYSYGPYALSIPPPISPPSPRGLETEPALKTPLLGYSYGPSASTSHPSLPHKPWKLPPVGLQSLPLPPKPWNLSPIFTNSIVRYNFGPSSRASICVGVVWTGPIPPPYTLAKMKILVRLQPVARANLKADASAADPFATQHCHQFSTQDCDQISTNLAPT